MRKIGPLIALSLAVAGFTACGTTTNTNTNTNIRNANSNTAVVVNATPMATSTR